MAILGSVQSRIDLHCTSITTAQRKKQRICSASGDAAGCPMMGQNQIDDLKSIVDARRRDA
jgi:hypothetical protein